MANEPLVEVARLVRRFRADYGIRRRPSAVEAQVMRHAAEMVVFAEVVRAAALAGTATIKDVVRSENAARRALRDMRVVLPKPAPPPLPSLQELMAAHGG